MLFKVTYNGGRFHGSQVQPSVRTVEGALTKALKSLGVRTRERPRLLSRTDTKVSALCNILELDGKVRLEELNNALPSDIIAWAKSDDRARLPATKTYLYFLPGRRDAKRLEKAASLFSGRHNFSNFARVEEHKSPVRNIEIRVSEEHGLSAIRFKGMGFLWQLVRRVVRVMVDYEKKRISKKELRKLLEAKTQAPYPAAPAENLTLVDIDVGASFIENKALKRMAEELSLPRTGPCRAALRRI